LLGTPTSEGGEGARSWGGWQRGEAIGTPPQPQTASGRRGRQLQGLAWRWPVMVGSGGGGWWRRRRRKTKMLGMGGGAVGMLFRINSTK
jgi:hypothetical protein